MKATWIGHACFKVEWSDGSVVFDPYQPGTVPKLSSVDETAGMVFCSHSHGDHNAAEAVKVTGAGKDTCKITQIETFHDHHEGEHRGPNTITIIEADGYKFAHLGDLGCELKEEQKEMLKDLDLMMVPVGGHFTIDAQEAYKLVSEVKPRIAVPMHYRDDDLGIGFPIIGTSDDFTELCECVVEPENAYVTDEMMSEAKKTDGTMVIVLIPENYEG